LYQLFNYTRKQNILVKSDTLKPVINGIRWAPIERKNRQKSFKFRAFPRKSEKKCLCKMLSINSLRKMTKKDENSYRHKAI